MNNSFSDKPKVLSLFSGGGGLDIGFHQAGFNIIACLEIDKASCMTLENNKESFSSEGVSIFNSDITKTHPSSLNLKNIDFIIGGPPCQSFSAAGRRAGGVPGINDTRGSLFWDYCQYVEYYKPKGFLFENVRGILQANHSKDWEVIKASFAELGYKLFYRILDAAGYGAPQHRERVILVGIREDLDIKFCFPRPTHGPDSINSAPYITAGEALADFDDPDEEEVPYGGKYGHLLPAIPPGLNYSFYTEELGHPQPLFAWRSKFSGFLYKLDPNSLSKTLVAHQGRYDGPFHWKNRKLTIQEFKRIQGFPDNYEILGSKVDILKQIGNSVSPKMAYYLALAVKKQVFSDERIEIALLNAEEPLSFDKRKGLKAKATRKSSQKKSLPLGHPSLLIFDIPTSTKNITDNIVIGERKITRKAVLSKGKWKISLGKDQDKSLPQVKISLNFDRLINNQFHVIEAVSSLGDFEDISLLWDKIHIAVASSSSYSDLSPLYGHFTEPYPKFDMNVQILPAKNSFFNFQEKLSNFQFLSELHPLEELTGMAGVMSPIEIVKYLRSIGFDIRVHETNRAIPNGYFRVCYPFTMPKDTKSYTIWADKGDHKHSDLIFETKKATAI